MTKHRLDKVFLIPLIFLFSNITLNVHGQKKDTLRSWDAALEIDNNFLTDNFMIGLVGTFNRGWLHTECRYNEEDFHTVSFWGGYNFSGGKQFTFTITPMVGFMMGSSYGMLPGVSLELAYKRWSFTNESALVLYSSSMRDESYIYTSAELDFSIDDMFFVGLSVNRNRIYKTKLDTQRGFGGGFTKGPIGVNGYIYNLFFDQPFGFVSVTYNF